MHAFVDHVPIRLSIGCMDAYIRLSKRVASKHGAPGACEEVIWEVYLKGKKHLPIPTSRTVMQMLATVKAGLLEHCTPKGVSISGKKDEMESVEMEK